MYKKKCPECGSFTYDESKNIWKCSVCGEHIDEVEAKKANIEELRTGQDKPDWTDID